MRRYFLPILFILLTTYHAVLAQDEGTITKKERVTRGKSVYFFAGPSYRFGNNDGDYSGGLNLEAGYLVRLTRIVSVGPSLSFSKFKYDESISDSFGNDDAVGNNIFYEDDPSGDPYSVKVVNMEGGDLKFVSLGFDFKIDFIPMGEERKFNAYAMAKPFVLFTSRSEVSAKVEQWWRYNFSDPPEVWDYGGGPDEFLSPETPGLDRWGAETEFSGGLNIGVGAEYALKSGIAFFIQGTIGFTFPVTYINTSAFEPYKLAGLQNPDYPFVKEGFTTLNISFGSSYRF